jgi:hypothetical protein
MVGFCRIRLIIHFRCKASRGKIPIALFQNIESFASVGCDTRRRSSSLADNQAEILLEIITGKKWPHTIGENFFSCRNRWL